MPAGSWEITQMYQGPVLQTSGHLRARVAAAAASAGPGCVAKDSQVGLQMSPKQKDTSGGQHQAFGQCLQKPSRAEMALTSLKAFVVLCCRLALGESGEMLQGVPGHRVGAVAFSSMAVHTAEPGSTETKNALQMHISGGVRSHTAGATASLFIR